jgi:hypothetical protein
MALDKKCVLFSGGKLISLLASENDGEGIMLTKNADNSWSINIVAKISEADAKFAIYKYSELKAEAGETIDQSNPNMPFFTAMDDSEKPIFAKLVDNSSLLPNYYRDQFGSITIKFNIGNFGKTQNPKTQNSETGRRGPRRPR